MQDSRSLGGPRSQGPTGQLQLPSRQLSLVIVTNPGGPCNSRTGSARGLGTPELANEGPRPRRYNRLGWLPVMIKPPILTLSPVCTSILVERLSGCAAVG